MNGTPRKVVLKVFYLLFHLTVTRQIMDQVDLAFAFLRILEVVKELFVVEEIQVRVILRVHLKGNDLRILVHIDILCQTMLRLILVNRHLDKLIFAGLLIDARVDQA